MAAPTYSTDLVVFDDATATTNWTGFTGYNADTGPVVETDYFIHGTACISTEVRKAGATSLVYNNGSSVGLGQDEAFFIWFFYLAPGTLEGIEDGGIYAGVGSGVSDFYLWYMDGSSSYAYSGWLNYAICPETSGSANHTAGTPTAGSHVVAGSGVDYHSTVSKGNPLGSDIIRYGRGKSRFEDGDAGNGYCTFAGFAAVNDNQTTGRLGLIQEIKGGYLYKGLIEIGSTSSAADFRDSNTAISIDNTIAVTFGFNKIEVINSSTNVDWDSVNFASLGTTSPGQFEMIDNAAVTMSSCTFTDMDRFWFQSNADIISTRFLGCKGINQGTASFTSCIFSTTNTNESQSFMTASALNLITYCDFEAGNTGHAIEALLSGSYQWVGNTNSGYGGTGGTNLVSNSGPGNAMFFNNSGGLITLNASAGAGSPSVRNGTGATTVVNNTVNYTVSNLVPGSEVRIYYTGSYDPDEEIDGVESSSDSFIYSYNYTDDHYVDIVIHHVDYVYIRLENQEMSNTNGGTSIQQQEDRWYDNP